jgi:hypothetical protein
MTTTEPPPEEKPCVPGDERPRCLFDFDQDGKVKTESGVAERTFDFPPLKIGFIFDVNHKAVFPHAAIQLVEWEMFGEIFATNFGASWNRVFVDLSWSAIPLMYIGPTIFAGYNIGEKDWSAGIGVNILRF